MNEAVITPVPMTPAEIAADLAGRLASGRGTPEEATRALAEISRTLRGESPAAGPNDAVAARARLDHLTADAAWRERFMQGDVATRREWQTLTEQIAAGDPVDAVMAGVVPDNTQIDLSSGNAASYSDMAKAVPELRSIGLGDDVIRQVLTDQPVSRAEYSQVKNWHDRVLKDRAFTERYLSGDPEAMRLMTLASVVLSSEIAE
jgi:hypothetical protein